METLALYSRHQSRKRIVYFLLMPINWGRIMRYEIFIAPCEMMVAKKVRDRIRRRMRRHEYKIFLSINNTSFILRIFPPQQIDDMRTIRIECFNHGTGKIFPSNSCMRRRITCQNSQYAIEHKYTLTRPPRKVSRKQGSDPCVF